MSPGSTVAELKRKHAEFLIDRLTSERAEAEWREQVPRFLDALLVMRVGDVTSPAAIADAADAVLTRALIDDAARGVAKRTLAGVIVELQAQKRATVGDHVPEAVRPKINGLLERPGLFPEWLLREVLEHAAVEAVTRDVLYHALYEFSERLNPINVLKKFVPFGGFGKIEAAKAEFDKKLEPEIRKFLHAFSRKSLKQTADFVVANIDTPPFVAVRRRLVELILDQELAALSRSVDVGAAEALLEIGLDVSAAVFEERTVKERRRAILLAAITARQRSSIAEVLAELGVSWRPDADALARATWPVLKAMVRSAPVVAYLTRVNDEFYDSL